MRWMCGIVVAVVLTSFAFLLLTGDFVGDGRTLVEVGDGRGIHEGDLLIVGGWLVGMLAAGFLVTAAVRGEVRERITST